MFGRKKRQRTEYERRCDRCAHVWYVPKSMAFRGSKAEIAGLETRVAGLKMRAAGSLFSSKNAVLLQRAEAQLAEVRSATCCPGCGSQSFQQNEVPIGQPQEG